MARRKDRYIAILIMPDGTETSSLYADLTEVAARRISAILERQKEQGGIKDYYLGPPRQVEYLHTLIYNADGLKAQLQSIIEDFRPRPE